MKSNPEICRFFQTFSKPPRSRSRATARRGRHLWRMLKYDEMNLYTSKRVTHFGCIHCCVEMFLGGILILTVCSCSGSLKTKKATLILPLNFTATTCGLQMEL